jgi:2'-5' RNA ligase
MGMKFSTLAGAGITMICWAAWSVGRAEAAEPSESPGEIVAIDVLLHPDATMLAAAAKANAELRGDYPAGFALDELHTPHISTVQRYVRQTDLERVYAALENVFAKNNPTKLELEAIGYFSFPMGAEGLAGIVVKPTAELRELQRQIVAAVEPFAVKGTAAAFVPSSDGAPIAPSMVVYVNEYVEKRTGKNFNPHVTVGLGTTSFVKRMIAAPFPKFSFKVMGASVYHLGNYGTAAVELWSPGNAVVGE